MRRKLVLTTSNSTSKAAKAAVKTEVSRHGYNHFGIRFAPSDRPRWTGQAVRRIPRLLAPVLHPGVQSLPAGTALYARPRPGLARQAHGPFALTFPHICVRAFCFAPFS